MQEWNLAIARAAHEVLATTPSAVFVLPLLMVWSGVFMHWFARQSKAVRADVIRLIQALRGK